MQIITTILLLGLSISNQPDNQKVIKQFELMQTQQNYEIATVGGGCFWCTEAVFRTVKAVVSVESGFSGGNVKNPSYQEVCNGSTGHAEVVQVRFDPKLISYKQILEVFFQTHNPTTLNQQGADTGNQYRSVIFFHDQLQKEIAERLIKELSNSGIYQKPIVTELSSFTAFYKAEDYHQYYFAKNPNAYYCNVVIRPKIEKFIMNYSGKLK